MVMTIAQIVDYLKLLKKKQLVIGNMFLVTLNQKIISKYGLRYISEIIMSFLELTEESPELWVEKMFGERDLSDSSREFLNEEGYLIVGKSTEEYACKVLSHIKRPEGLILHRHKHILTFEDVLRLRDKKIIPGDIILAFNSVNNDFDVSLV